MAKTDEMPSKDVIDGFKGLIDFYYWKGIPVARRWPRYFSRTPSPSEATIQTAFAYINRLYGDLPLLINVQLTLFAARSTLTGKDFLVRGYIKGLYDLMPPEYYATEETQLLVLSELEDVPKHANLHILAGTKDLGVDVQASVIPTGAAMDATLVEVRNRLNAIMLIQGDLVFVVRSGALGHGAGFTDLVDISGKGILERVEMTSDVILSNLRLTIDGQDFRLLLADGTGVQWVRPQVLNTLGGESAFWKEGAYDTVNNYYSLFLKAPIQYNSALYVGYNQLSGGAANIAVAAYYRPLT